jgi:hypothetical protein
MEFQEFTVLGGASGISMRTPNENAIDLGGASRKQLQIQL